VSKAFTKESDELPAAPPRRLGVAVPDPNYMTPAGARAARSELVSARDDDRIRELTEHLATAQILEPPVERDTASLGAQVTVEAPSGQRKRYRLVGALEADARRGLVFWRSPIALALYGARIGDTVVLPRGDEVEIVAIDYD
jgi:transcription elongation GreA/GreB family factor